ncbi:MAG: endolytic transglycosylase MltG [Clostridiales bacterium]|nr:endolytic transglycosylase MltG [Clostridiales bacterium]
MTDNHLQEEAQLDEALFDEAQPDEAQFTEIQGDVMQGDDSLLEEDMPDNDLAYGYADGEGRANKGRGPLILLLCLVLLAAGVGGGVYGGRYLKAQRDSWMLDLGPANPGGGEVIFTLERGWSLTRTAEALYYQGLIRSADSFVRLGKQENQAESLKAGRFLLSSSMSSEEILEELVKGSVLTTRFTIPEGYTLRQIAKVLSEKGIAEEEEFWRCVRVYPFEYDFLEGLPGDEHRLEGYLFPDTYVIELDESVDRVINRMLKRYEEIWASLSPGHEEQSDPANSGLSDRDLLILASIVQNEIMRDDERPTAAGVFLNRLEKHILLQSCSTVQYYFDEPKFPLLTADTEIDFPYNTYIYPGLPPGPVSSPGRASLEAVLAPEDTEYLFFVAREDGSGGHYFSKTLAEHNRAVAQARSNRSK